MGGVCVFMHVCGVFVQSIAFRAKGLNNVTLAL